MASEESFQSGEVVGWKMTTQPLAVKLTTEGFYLQIHIPKNLSQISNAKFYKLTCPETAWVEFVNLMKPKALKSSRDSVRQRAMQTPIRTAFLQWVQTYTKCVPIDYDFELFDTKVATCNNKYKWVGIDSILNFAEKYVNKKKSLTLSNLADLADLADLAEKVGGDELSVSSDEPVIVSDYLSDSSESSSESSSDEEESEDKSEDKSDKPVIESDEEKEDEEKEDVYVPKIGDKIDALFRKGHIWYKGVIIKVNDDETVNVKYEYDIQDEYRIPFSKIRPTQFSFEQSVLTDEDTDDDEADIDNLTYMIHKINGVYRASIANAASEFESKKYELMIHREKQIRDLKRMYKSSKRAHLKDES